MNPVSGKERDKRNFARMRIDTPAEVIIRGRDQQVSGICRDLSGGGMLIDTRVQLQAGTEVEIRLASHYGDNLMLKARAQVVRVRPIQTGKFSVGLKILEMLD